MLTIFKNKKMRKNEEKVWVMALLFPATSSNWTFGIFGISPTLWVFTGTLNWSEVAVAHTRSPFTEFKAQWLRRARFPRWRSTFNFRPLFCWFLLFFFFVFRFCFILLYFNVCCRRGAEVLLFYCAMWILVPMEIWMCVFVKLLCVTTSVTTPAAVLSAED